MGACAGLCGWRVLSWSVARRFVFNQYPGEWEKRRGGKYAWNYLLFFTYLAEKDAEEYNGLENFVTEQVCDCCGCALLLRN